MKDVYTLADLRNAPADPDAIFTRREKPARLAVIGDPIAHSKSPELHQPALDALGLNITYIRVQLHEQEFVEGVTLMKELGFIGCNVTIPHKEKALQWAPHPAPFTQQVGVANTLVLQEGKCFTTDPTGLESALIKECSFSLKGKNILILGAGGGAGSAVAQYFSQKPLQHLSLHNRTAHKLDTIYQQVITSGHLPTTQFSRYGGSEFPTPSSVDLIINATSLGLKPDQPSPLPSSFLRSHHTVYDMTYGCTNALARDCQTVKAAYSDGLSMLRHQGAEAFKIWFPGTEPLALMGL